MDNTCSTVNLLLPPVKWAGASWTTQHLGQVLHSTMPLICLSFSLWFIDCNLVISEGTHSKPNTESPRAPCGPGIHTCIFLSYKMKSKVHSIIYSKSANSNPCIIQRWNAMYKQTELPKNREPKTVTVGERSIYTHQKYRSHQSEDRSGDRISHHHLHASFHLASCWTVSQQAASARPCWRLPCSGRRKECRTLPCTSSPDGPRCLVWCSIP